MGRHDGGLKDRLRLPLPAPAEQTHCAEAGGEVWGSGGEGGRSTVPVAVPKLLLEVVEPIMAPLNVSPARSFCCAVREQE
jgi:hypothetical protein